jgi:hypothetical protein
LDGVNYRALGKSVAKKVIPLKEPRDLFTRGSVSFGVFAEVQAVVELDLGANSLITPAGFPPLVANVLMCTMA